MTIDEILGDFAVLDDWDDRYRYLIELGRKLTPLPEADRTLENKVQGCASQVWLSRHTDEAGRLNYIGDSDAIIVRGLIAVVLALFSGKRPEEITATDADKVFRELDLGAHLSSQRSNGLRSMVARIKADAKAAVAA